METKRAIRLIAADLDGTLLNDEKQLCRGAYETLKKASEKGIFIVPVTGRPYLGIPEFIRNMDCIEYIICSNGASVIETKDEKEIYSFSMSNEKSVEVFGLLKETGCVFEPFCDGVCFTEQKILDSYIGLFRGSPIEEYLLSTRVICPSIEALFKKEGRCADEFFVSCENREQRDRLTAVLDKTDGVQYWFFDEKYIEITRKGCDKGAALEVLCRHLGIDIENTVAFGDSGNDLALLGAAGISVAMGNAHPLVKEKADLTADTNNNNGVGRFVEEILQG